MSALAIAWFWMLAAMLTVYAVLDGYDLGVGALHLALARTNQERRVCLNAIGPVWNGNEVWIIAAGGFMVVAFPRLYAVSFSGFYLALIVVLWLLILRGVSIEFRGQIAHALWTGFWDATFSAASLLLTLLLGVALGNVVRGLPIGPEGTFQGTFTMMLNPYALPTGLLAVAVLAWHGANFMRTKAEGELLERARRWSRRLGRVAFLLAVAATAATFTLRADIGANFRHYPFLLAFPLLAVAGFALGIGSNVGDPRAFRSSVMVIAGLLGSAAATAFPHLLYSTAGAENSLTLANSAADGHALATSMLANGVGIIAVVFYHTYLHRAFRGKVQLSEHGY